MIDFILKFLNFKTCSHPNIEPNKPLSYCPDCGKLIRTNWYVIKCRCCGKKRVGIIRGNKVIPVARFCTNCGTEEYNVEKISSLDYFSMSYAIAKKEEEVAAIEHDYTETWIDEKEILNALRFLPQYLN